MMSQVISSGDAPIFVGNALPLDKVPIGTMAGRLDASRNEVSER